MRSRTSSGSAADRAQPDATASAAPARTRARSPRGWCARALTATAVLALGAALLVVAPARPAEAADCAPSGGASIPAAAAPDGELQVSGRGWGHGAGMSQYGALGAANLGCDYREILSTYFPGTTVGAPTAPPNIRVSLFTAATALNVTVVAGPVPWELCTVGATATCQDTGVNQPEGVTYQAVAHADGSFALHDSSGKEVWRGGTSVQRLKARLSIASGDRRVVQLSSTGHQYKWGLLELTHNSPGSGRFYVTIDVAPADRYVYGLGEVPSSWPVEALKAQAVAARSYAWLRQARYGGQRQGCICDVYATTNDQVYVGYDKERFTDGSRWRAAVDATANQIGLYDGKPIDAFYSSSHGGYSESSAFVFGGSSLPYLQPVDDSRWDAASNNPYRTWSNTFRADDAGAKLGVGTLTRIELLDPKGHKGRVGHPDRDYGGVRVTGTKATKTLSGDDVRRALGLRSTLFSAVLEEAESPPPTPPAITPTPISSPPPATSPPTSEVVERVAGPGRIETAVAVSRRYWSSAGRGLLATSESFPDALAAGTLAAKLRAPLLLTAPGQVSQAVLGEFQRLGVGTVMILGGEAAISTAVEQQLHDAGLETVRLVGADRYETAQRIAQEAGPAATREVVLVLGEDWPDAVSAGALSAAPDRLPTLLTRSDELPEATVTALQDLDTEVVLIVGGTSTVSTGVEQQVRELGYEVRRIAGATRYDTSAKVAQEALSRLGGNRPVVLASGQAFPDALSAAALGAQVSAPLLLVAADDLADSPESRALLQQRAAQLRGGTVVGGTAAVGEKVRSQVAAAISGLAP